MRIALITDTHYGVRNDNVSFMDNSKKFLDEIFFPTISSQGIDTVVHLGDLVDRRKYININTARRLREDFLQQIEDRELNFHLIAGNHDTYYKNTNSINSLREVVRGYGSKNNWYIYDQIPKEVDFDGTIVLMLPWICDENRKIVFERMRSTNAQIVMGHLELAGFEMYKGSMVSHGDDANLFNRFDLVMSGHYHHRSSNGHIFYLGSHGEFTWSDYNDPKGFHIFDTETRSLTFVKNPFIMFDKVWYDDQDKTMDQVMDHDFAQYKGKIVKVIVSNKTNPYWFDNFIEAIEKSQCIEMQVVEDHMNLNLEEDSDIVNETESTIDIFKKFIGQVNDPNFDKVKLEKTIVELYEEALAIE
jgi:DNA repair exonuclease SbcCD nuclease subunit